MGISKTLKALSDPIRRDILVILREHEMSAGEISSKFTVTAATVSYHLSILKDAGLVFEHKDRNYVLYTLNSSVLDDLVVWLKNLGRNENHE